MGFPYFFLDAMGFRTLNVSVSLILVLYFCVHTPGDVGGVLGYT